MLFYARLKVALGLRAHNSRSAVLMLREFERVILLRFQCLLAVCALVRLECVCIQSVARKGGRRQQLCSWTLHHWQGRKEANTSVGACGQPTRSRRKEKGTAHCIETL